LSDSILTEIDLYGEASNNKSHDKPLPQSHYISNSDNGGFYHFYGIKHHQTKQKSREQQVGTLHAIYWHKQKKYSLRRRNNERI